MKSFLRCILCVFFLCVIVFCLDNFFLVAPFIFSPKEKKQTQLEKLNEILDETGLSIAHGAKLIHFSKPDVLIDPIWVAKIIIPTSSYDSLKQILLKKTVDDTVHDGALSKSTTWWKPTDVVLTKQYLANSQTFVKVVISKEGRGFAVYIECVVF